MAHIYLDHAATTPMRPEVIAAYADVLGLVGNPSSIHSQGQRVKALLEDARAAVAASIGAEPVEVTFTSGGTEAINLAIKGLYWQRDRPRIILTRAEHHASLDAADWLERHEGAQLDFVPVDDLGRIDVVAYEAALSRNDGQDVALVTTLWANNEVGTVQPVAELVEIAARYGVPVHADAVAAYGHLPIDFDASGLAALSISAHKIGGPVGVGALALARSAELVPLVHGGNQQRARSGTMDATGAHAFAVAAALAVADLAATDLAATDPAAADRAGQTRLAVLRDRLIAGVRAAVPTAVLRGEPETVRSADGMWARLPGNAHFTFPGCEGDSLLYVLDTAGFSVSTGSACQAGVPEASHVLLAMGVSETDARGALRFTLAETTTEAEIDALVAALPDAVARATRAGLA